MSHAPHEQPCLLRGCTATCTYTKPLCYPHWQLWERSLHEVMECQICHWFVNEFPPHGMEDMTDEHSEVMDIIDSFSSGPPCFIPEEWESAFEDHQESVSERFGRSCYRCLLRTFMSSDERPSGAIPQDIMRTIIKIPDFVPPPAHIPLTRLIRYVYLLRIDGGDYYVGMTSDLASRLAEHQSERGGATTTKGRNPQLVYFEEYEGNVAHVKAREDYLILLNTTFSGRRQLSDMIEHFQSPLRLLNLTRREDQ